MLRSEVGHQTGLRRTPTLAFIADALPDNAKVIDELLMQRAAAADAEVHRVAAGAAYAGDPDPYRSADEDDEASGVACVTDLGYGQLGSTRSGRPG